jgi:hypothetical protein
MGQRVMGRVQAAIHAQPAQQRAANLGMQGGDPASTARAIDAG